MSQQSVAGVLLFPCCFTRGYYQLEFRGSFNKKPITGPSVNITVLPDPTKPVSLTVKYDTNTKFPAGGKFPGLYLFIFSVRRALVSLKSTALVLCKLRAALSVVYSVLGDRVVRRRKPDDDF